MSLTDATSTCLHRQAGLSTSDQQALDECMAAVNLLPPTLKYPRRILGLEVARFLEKRKGPKRKAPRRRKVRLAGKPGGEFMIEEGKLPDGD